MEATADAASAQLTSRLIDHLRTDTATRTALAGLVESNGTTLFVDIACLSDQQPDLAAALQQGFATHYPAVQEAFRTHALATVGRELDIAFFNPTRHLRMRGLRAENLGDLVSFTGTATRSSQVRPELCVGAFTCKDCATRIPAIKQEYVYTQPVRCPNHLCANRSRFELDASASTFSNWQRIHVQEDTAELIGGALPRTIDVIIRNDLVEHVRPGARLTFSGYCAAVPGGQSIAASRAAATLEGTADTKPQRCQKELAHRLVFMCVHFSETAAATPAATTEFTADQLATIRRVQATPNLYATLSESLFATIHGHAAIKSAILLMLVGGVSKRSDIRLRGDINVLLVGDPGTAKSQFLKQTAAACPRAVYTSGKSSSAAGLTAAVVRDAETGEFTIEAGALMLADGGVCCIDEFDKMTYKDQVSIHEAMEQQTITIAKAGINATLNSRASILAAANPLRGRYDASRTLRQNVNLSAPIMSRFDLFFVLIDTIDAAHDRRVARKVLENHVRFNSAYVARGKENAAGMGDAEGMKEEGVCELAPPFTVEEIMLYVQYVRPLRPTMSAEAQELLAEKYRALRQDSLLTPTNYKMTARHLESMIRLSEALAKLHNEAEVLVPHVQEAYRLLKSSVVEISNDDIELGSAGGATEGGYVMKAREYARISSALVYLLKGEALGQEELIGRYLEMVEGMIDSEAMLEMEREKCRRVIEFLMASEGVLYEQDGLVYIHPNYDI